MLCCVAVDTSGQDTPHLDSFALHLQDGTIIIGEEPARGREVRRRVKVRPHSTPHRLFRHYATIASDGAPAKPRPRSQRSANQSRRSWSARTAASSLGSHVSRCSVPGPYDHRAGSETDSLCGPHAAISALLGPPQCPRDNVRSEVHHRSAFYHVPGRYPTSVHRSLLQLAYLSLSLSYPPFSVCLSLFVSVCLSVCLSVSLSLSLLPLSLSVSLCLCLCLSLSARARRCL